MLGRACRYGLWPWCRWVTVMCNAANATKAKALEAAAKHGGEVQVELFGNWNYEEAKEWLKIGLKQVIYHQSRDALNAGASWDESNMQVVKELANMGCGLGNWRAGARRRFTVPEYSGTVLYCR